MKPGERVMEKRGPFERHGVLREVYELTDKRGNPEGVKRAVVLFDTDKIPTTGVRVSDLTVESPSGSDTNE